jgi:hypothetical protein
VNGSNFAASSNFVNRVQKFDKDDVIYGVNCNRTRALVFVFSMLQTKYEIFFLTEIILSITEYWALNYNSCRRMDARARPFNAFIIP